MRYRYYLFLEAPSPSVFFPSSFAFIITLSKRWEERKREKETSVVHRLLATAHITLFPFASPFLSPSIYFHAMRKILGLLTLAMRLPKISRRNGSFTSRTTFMSLSRGNYRLSASPIIRSLEFLCQTFNMTDQQERFVIRSTLLKTFYTSWTMHRMRVSESWSIFRANILTNRKFYALFYVLLL